MIINETTYQQVTSGSNLNKDEFGLPIVVNDLKHLDNSGVISNISNKPKYVPSYSLESPVYKGKFVYTQVEENRVSLLIIFCNKDTIILDLVNNTVSINFDGICFGPQETVPEVLKSKNRVYEDWSNCATRRAIELYHESISKYSGPQ